MPSSIASLPPDQLSHLQRAYADAVAAKRRQMVIGGVVLLACIIIAGIVSEVRPVTFFENVFRFFSYMGRIFMLESGASVFSDPREWFWGLSKWLHLLWQTLVIAYVGTLLGALAGLVPTRRAIELRHFFDVGAVELLRSMAGAAWQFVQLAAQTRLLLDAWFRATWRLVVSRRHLLEWTTAAQAQAQA
eukprot:gene51014-68287_t